MIPVLNLLAMGGGHQPIVIDGNTLHVPYEDTILHVYRGDYDMKTIYLDKAATKRISVDWANWLPSGASISSSAWETEGSTDMISVANSTNTSTVTETYVSCTDYDEELFLKNTIVTDEATPQTEARSFLIKTVRTF